MSRTTSQRTGPLRQQRVALRGRAIGECDQALDVGPALGPVGKRVQDGGVPRAVDEPRDDVSRRRGIRALGDP